ncbi:MAG TPA: hypothetical protein DEA90_14505 [Opitutae bacterium]|nr:hypothetical protein [Puniceicoccaceae bacterium]HBR95369.1 hypothetical protein [Opitutae bacterium]
MNNKGSLHLISSIVGPNTTSSHTTADIRDFNSLGTVHFDGPNLIGDNTFSRISNISGASVNPNLHLAPLGNYGGSTQTMPPLPNSPAIDAGGSEALSSSVDQRGFARLVGGGLDLGAVELQGNDLELAALIDATFELDSDSAGDANGLERALGTDPFIADPSHPNKFRMIGTDVNGRLEFNFGYEDASITLALTRSIDLIDFSTVIETSDDFSTFGLQTLFDPNPPEGKAFYRLEATR